MSWKSMALQCVDTPLHIYNRGVDGQVIFREEPDYLRWMEFFTEMQQKHGVTVFLYALIPNHFHISLSQSQPYEVSGYIKDVCWRYARYHNRKYRRHGPLFSGRFRVTLVPEDTGLLRLSHYIHMNPVKAGLVHEPEQWPHSSIARYVDGDASPGMDVSRILNLVGGTDNYRRFLTAYNPADALSINEDLVHGNIKATVQNRM